ncbi:MAG: gamma-glutamyl-gamma-aminobutyrate hydrolase family protein, partial [Woeseia sp.]
AIVDGEHSLPVLLPSLGDRLPAEELLAGLDGLFLTGSPSNVEPHHYGGAPSRSGTLHDPARDATTFPLIEVALAAGMPVFAVCRGFQELNVVLGGTLHPFVHEVPGYHVHKENPADPLDIQYGPAHPVNLVEGGLLRSLAGQGVVTVNSLHSQGIAKLARDVRIEALADDGLVEAFSVDQHNSFALAVQWHPEWRVTENEFSMAMFSAFGDACRDFAQRHR